MKPGADRPAPPRWAERILRATAPERDVEPMMGDLAEEFSRLAGSDLRAARIFYWRHALRSIPSNVPRRAGDAFDALVLGRPAHATLNRKDARRGDDAMTSLVNELALALRSFARRPRFAATIVATIALAISSVTVIFGAVDGLVLSPFPFPDPDRLITVGSAFPKVGAELSFMENLSPAEYLDIAREARTLDAVVAWDMGNRQITVGDDTRNAFSAFWWGDAMPTLGMRPRYGRGFSAEEIRSGAKVALVSSRFFRDRLAGDGALVGRPLLVNGEPYTLIGVLPERTLVYGTDLWIPMSAAPDLFPRGRRQFQVLARIAEGRSIADVNAELDLIARRTESAHRGAQPEYERWRLEARTFVEVNVAFLRPASIALAFGALFVLAVATTNVASILLARAVERSREMATRLALGAGRGQIVRQLSVEAFVLTAFGALAGVALAGQGIGAAQAALSRLPFPLPGELELSARVLGFATAVSAFAAFVFGLTPAWSILRSGRRSSLVAQGIGAHGLGAGGRLRAQRVFLGVQVAFAALLVCCGGLLLRSLARIQAVEPGFDAGRLLGFRTTLPQARYPNPASYAKFFERAQADLRAIPGVEDVTLASQTPPAYFSNVTFLIDGQDAEREGAMKRAFFTTVSPSYFGVMGLRLLEGRVLSPDDRGETARVAVMNDAAARRYFPNDSAVGKRLRVGPKERPLFVEIVGVVSSARNRGLDTSPQPELFATFAQAGYPNQLMTVLRTTLDPVSIVPSVRRTLASIDPLQPIYQVQSLDQSLGNQGLPRRMATSALVLLALFSLALAAAGVYAVSSYVAAARSRELGLRIALGATGASVRRFIARKALLPVAAGGAAGLLGGVFASRAMGALLFETRPTDPLALGAAISLLGLVAFVAADAPARRASAIDPARALAVD